MHDKDSTPDGDLTNDPFVETDDVTIDRVPGDEDDNDRASIDMAQVKRDNLARGGGSISGTNDVELASTGTRAGLLVIVGLGLVAVGCVELRVTRRRRSPNNC